MGIYGHRFYFKEGLPTVKAIKEKFLEITGLRLNFEAYLHLDKLITDQDDIIDNLTTIDNSRGFLQINTPYFSCADFSSISLGDFIEKNSFHIECGIRAESMYFWHALIKSILEIGGHTFKYHYYPYEKDLVVENYFEPYHPYERKWKRIKKWAEMSEFEKAAFKGKYA